jgi:hypothetical protein
VLELIGSAGWLPWARVWSAGDGEFDRDLEFEGGGDSLEGGEGGAYAAGFETGDRGLAGSHPGGEVPLAEACGFAGGADFSPESMARRVAS